MSGSNTAEGWPIGDAVPVTGEAISRKTARKVARVRLDGSEMERVNGIGGIFFRAKDPVGLADWYQANLGVRKTPESYEENSWWQESGPTVFAPFPQNTDYFDESKQWMVNFRVADLDSIVDQLRSKHIEVVVENEVFPNGRFAHLSDPEGNRIELWEPAGIDLTSSADH